MALKSLNSNKRCCYEVSNEPAKIFKAEHPLKENIPPTDRDSSNDLSDVDDFPEKLHIVGGGTPKKNPHLKEEPITPHANIKLLTSLAATRDYANCLTPKSRKSNESPIVKYETPDIVKPSRKEKSLALVCSRFLEIYPLDPDPGTNIVSLDEATYKLGVERRRLYDIVNVFESVDMLRKQAKNRYLWFGKNNLQKSLQRIKTAASEEGIKEKLEYVLQFEESVPPSRHICILDDVLKFNKNLDTKDCVFKDQLPTSQFPEVRKEKSLAIMSQKFLMLFLVSPSQVISLSSAAKVLNGFQKNDKGVQIKTQIRRLYDIANVLSSIGLIRKESSKIATGRKPAFHYTGPNLENGGSDGTSASQSIISSNTIKSNSLSRKPSFQEICEAAEVEHQKLFQSENLKPAAPLGKNILNITNNITSFADLNHTVKDSEEKNTKCLNSTHDIRSDYTVERRPHIVTLQVQQNMKVINLPKNILSNNSSFYVLDCANFNTSNSSYLNDNVLLVPINHPNDIIQVKSSENKDIHDQTMVLSSSQREAILKSLNITLSPNEIALINLAGSLQPSNSSPTPHCNTLKIINKNNEALVAENKFVPQERLYLIQDEKVNYNYQVSNVSSSTNSTRNSSPSNNTPRYDSPLSIPSGYATPIPSTSSDITFASNSEVDCFLKKIENPSSSEYANKSKEYPSIENATYFELVPKLEIKDTALNSKSNYENNYKQTENSQILPQNVDSCSSESLNAEVSSILKEVPLGEATVKNKGFLIDEKTILSPIKKPDETTTALTPSPLMTPPYVARDKIFRFNSPINFQNSHEVKILKSQPIQLYGKNSNKMFSFS